MHQKAKPLRAKASRRNKSNSGLKSSSMQKAPLLRGLFAFLGLALKLEKRGGGEAQRDPDHIGDHIIG